MTKNCAHDRTAASSVIKLEESLRRLQENSSLDRDEAAVMRSRLEADLAATRQREVAALNELQAMRGQVWKS